MPKQVTQHGRELTWQLERSYLPRAHHSSMLAIPVRLWQHPRWWRRTRLRLLQSTWTRRPPTEMMKNLVLQDRLQTLSSWPTKKLIALRAAIVWSVNWSKPTDSFLRRMAASLTGAEADQLIQAHTRGGRDQVVVHKGKTGQRSIGKKHNAYQFF